MLLCSNWMMISKRAENGKISSHKICCSPWIQLPICEMKQKISNLYFLASSIIFKTHNVIRWLTSFVKQLQHAHFSFSNLYNLVHTRCPTTFFIFKVELWYFMTTLLKTLTCSSALLKIKRDMFQINMLLHIPYYMLFFLMNYNTGAIWKPLFTHSSKDVIIKNTNKNNKGSLLICILCGKRYKGRYLWKPASTHTSLTIYYNFYFRYKVWNALKRSKLGFA